MKQELTVSGRIELTRQELTQVVKDFIANKHKLNVTRAIYLSDSKDAMKGVVLDVVQEPQEKLPHKFPEKKMIVKRKAKGGSKRINKGIFPFLREYFDDCRKRKVKILKFGDLYKDVRDLFPHMEEKRLSLYLYDVRQLKGIKYKSEDNTIHL